MARFHIFGIQSRLGVPRPSIGQTNPRRGVELGPEAIIDAMPEWLSEESVVDVITLPSSETLTDPAAPVAQQLEDVGAMYQQAKETILQYWKPHQTAVFLGGDHSVSAASLAAVQERFADKYVTVIHFDSHGDVHLPATSPSGNFHGMWLRSVVDPFPVESLNTLNATKLPANRLQTIGNLVLEEAEEAFFTQNNLEPISSLMIQEENSPAMERLIQHISIADHVHISFDIDVFAAPLVPGTGTPNLKGMQPNEVWPFVAAIRDTVTAKGGTMSLDIVEYNPSLDVADKTLQLCLEVLSRFLRD